MERKFSQSEFEAVLETLVDGVIFIDQSGMMILFNRACQKMFGYEPAEVLGKNVKMLMPQRYAVEHDDYLKRYIETGERRIIGIGREVTGLRKNGSTFPMDLSVGESERDGKTIFVGVIRDLTERHQAQARFEQIQDRFFHLSRIVSVNEMGTAIAHEVNQPIGAAINYIETARLKLKNDEMLDREQLEKILESAEEQNIRASNIILRLRAFLEKGHFEPRPTDVIDVVESSLKLARHFIKSHQVHINVCIQNELPAVIVDMTQIQQVMVNLLKNACEAMADDQTRNLEIKAALGSCGEKVEFRVTDTGHGLSKDTKETLFTPFSSSKPGGLGMGLAISKSIISLHNGEIWTSANAPHGTVFHFSLPVENTDTDSE